MKLERRGNSVLYNVTKTRYGSLLDAIVQIECDGIDDREAIESEIVRRVNCHEELVAALRDTLPPLMEFEDDRMLRLASDREALDWLLERVRTVLAAEGGAE